MDRRKKHKSFAPHPACALCEQNGKSQPSGFVLSCSCNRRRSRGGARNYCEGPFVELFVYRRTELQEENCLGSMPSFFMREISVVRLRPARAAAPSVPPTRPLVSSRMPVIC